MKQNFKRKLLAGLLSACMMFQTVGTMPAYAVDSGIMPLVDTPVASVTTGGTTTEYSTLDDAWSQVDGKTATLKLLDNVTNSSLRTLTSGNVTLDLNGYTWTEKQTTERYAIQVTDAATILTVEDTSSTQTGKMVNTIEKTYALFSINNATLNITGGSYSNSNSWIILGNPSITNISGGTFNGKGTDDSAFYLNGGTATFSGGTIETGSVYIRQSAVVELSGGTFCKIWNVGGTATVKEGYAFRNTTGEKTWESYTTISKGQTKENLTVQKAPVSITKQPAYEGSLDVGYTEGPILSVTAEKTETAGTGDIIYKWYENGTLIADATTNSYQVPISKVAGTYAYYCKLSIDGYEISSQTVTIVVQKPVEYVASLTIGNNEPTYCTTLQAAFDLCNTTQAATVTLLKNVTLEDGKFINIFNNISRNITFDLQNYKLQGKEERCGILYGSTNKEFHVTIKGSGTLENTATNSKTGNGAICLMNSKPEGIQEVVIQEQVKINAIGGQSIYVNSSKCRVIVKDQAVVTSSNSYKTQSSYTGVINAPEVHINGGVVTNNSDGFVICTPVANAGEVYVSGGSIQGTGTPIVAGKIYYAVTHDLDAGKGSISQWTEEATTTYDNMRYGKKDAVITFTVTPTDSYGITGVPTITTANGQSIAVTKTGTEAYGVAKQALTFSYTQPSSPVSVSVSLKSVYTITAVAGKTVKVYDKEAFTITAEKDKFFTWNGTGTASIGNYYTKGTDGTYTKTTIKGSGATAVGGAPVKAGTYYVKLDVSADNDYLATTAYMPITISQSGTTFDGGITVDRINKTYTYGEIITVKVTPKATGIAARSFTPPTLNQMALFVGTKQITMPVIAIAGIYTMTYDTKGKDLAIGSNIITAKYVGNESMADYSDTVTVTLNKKAIASATVSAGATKAYDGTGSYTGVVLTPNATDLGGDIVTATADGTATDANVGATKAFTATSVTLGDTDAGYYTLAADKVSGKVAITAKSVNATDKNDTRNIVQGTGTFAEPSIDSGVGSEKVTGTIAYNYNGQSTYAGVVTELAKLANDTTASVGYTLTAIGNYAGTITGTLTMTVVDLNFTTTGALKFKTNPTYGDLWSGILTYDSSKLSATLNGTAVAGTFTFKVDSNAFNATAVPKAGTFAYQVTFTATSDSKFKDVAVLSGNVTVAQREASLSWSNTELTYNGNALKPTATVSNKVTGDDVAVTVSGEQTGAGDSHTATASVLTGTSAANYKLPTVNITTYKIKAAAATGNVTLSSTDANSNRKLDNGDTVTADISAVAPAGGTVSYQWKKTTNGTISNLGTNASYTLTASDTKGKIFCMVTFTGNVTGTKESNKLDIAKELLAGTISITGNNTIGSALTVSIPTNTTITTADYTIAWYRGDVVIAGATATSYTLTKNDLGKTIKVVITARETSEGFTGALTSNEATVPATAAEKPVITATADNGYVTVNWTKPFDNGSTITGYTLTVKQGATEINGSPFIIGADATSYKVANLTNGTAYSFVLTAINGIGNTTSDVKTATPTQPSSGGGSVVIIPPTPTENDPTPPTKSEIIASATVNKKGNARITVTDKMVTDAIKKAQAEAKKNGIAIELKVDTGNKTPNSISVNLSKMGLDTLVREKVEEFKISSPLADLTFDSKTLQEILKQTGGDVTINVSRADVSKLSKKARKEIGNRPVFNLSITDKDGKIISDFGGGSVTVSIPYTLQPGENPNNVQAYFVDGKGKLHQVTSTYDPVTKCLIFVTNHFSIYGIGYKEKAPKFKDIKKHWAKSDIEFVTARGLLSGKNKTKFSPNTAMTRGMFVTALGRLAGVNVRGYKKSSFTDIKSTDYFMGYVEWANKNGIVKGTSATTFSPNAAITRQEMAVIMKNYAKAMNYTLPKTRTAVTFADNANIASWAADEVKSMQMAGVIMGKDGNRFDPTSSITRAEASAVLRRYIELVIDKATAQGLDRNDSGKFVYYENGKLFTGTKTINGMTYHFGNDGICIKIEP